MSSRGLVLLVLALLVLCLGFATVAGFAGVIWYSQREAPAAVVYPPWQDPTAVGNLKIDPIVSLGALSAGEVAGVNRMLAQGAADSAYAATVYSVEMSDRQRLAQLLLVTERYVALEQAERARPAYQAVMDIAALSPDLSDYERADALAQVAAGFYTLKDRNMARLALNAGRSIARHSPFLKDASRFALLGKLLKAAQEGNDRERVQRLNDDRSNYVDQDTTSSALPEARNPLPAIEPYKKDAKLQAAETRRIDAAKAIGALAGKTQPALDDKLVTLGDALFAEDEEYKRALTAGAAQGSTLAQKVSLAQARVNWLTLKFRVARNAFGARVVDEWIDDVDAIRIELAKAYETLTSLREEQAASLPKAQDVELAQEHIVRRLVLAGRLGLYPGYPEDALIERLGIATEDLINSMPGAALRVKVDGPSGKLYFHLTSDDGWFGQDDDAAPAKRAPASGATPTRRPTASAPATAVPTPAVGASPAAPAATTSTPTRQPANTQAPAPVPPTNTPVPAPSNTPALPPAVNTSAPALATPTRPAYP